ncbi:MAG: phosphopantetheine adenylyltransferase [Archangiaceae bacterium]|nr:phosphopantetheine adenylyltransferase [Archangiaceae bacterium]
MLFRLLVLSVSLLNLVPLVVAVAPRFSVTLYGLSLDQPVLEIVMRHRAVLLGCVGVGLALAAFRDDWWLPALSFALVSKLAFLALCLVHVNELGPLRRVAGSDVIALLLLAVAAFVRR